MGLPDVRRFDGTQNNLSLISVRVLFVSVKRRTKRETSLPGGQCFRPATASLTAAGRPGSRSPGPASSAST
jgi:hypothetical protein